jgi:hypothetical protein
MWFLIKSILSLHYATQLIDYQVDMDPVTVVLHLCIFSRMENADIAGRERILFIAKIPVLITSNLNKQ